MTKGAESWALRSDFSPALEKSSARAKFLSRLRVFPAPRTCGTALLRPRSRPIPWSRSTRNMSRSRRRYGTATRWRFSRPSPGVRREDSAARPRVRSLARGRRLPGGAAAACRKIRRYHRLRRDPARLQSGGNRAAHDARALPRHDREIPGARLPRGAKPLAGRRYAGDPPPRRACPERSDRAGGGLVGTPRQRVRRLPLYHRRAQDPRAVLEERRNRVGSEMGGTAVSRDS